MSAIFQTGFSLERGTSGYDTCENSFMHSGIHKQMQNVLITFPSIFDYSTEELFFNKLFNRSMQLWFNNAILSVCNTWVSQILVENIYEWWNFKIRFQLKSENIPSQPFRESYSSVPCLPASLNDGIKATHHNFAINAPETPNCFPH